MVSVMSAMSAMSIGLRNESDERYEYRSKE